MLLIITLILVVIGVALALFAEHTETGRKLLGVALQVWIAAKGNLRIAHRMIKAQTYGMSQLGGLTVETVIYIFVAIVIIYQLIPSISSQNSTVQTSANVSSMSKFAAGLGEWLFPLFGVLALVFLLWRRKSGKSV